MSADAPAAPVRYAFGDIVVDARAHRVTRAGLDVALEPKAYSVLLELLRCAGAAVPRDDLLDAVWGHRHVTPAVLNRVIAMLRRALGDDADHPHLIRTVHGTGYSFIGAVTATDSPAAGTVVESPQSAGDPVGILASGIDAGEARVRSAPASATELDADATPAAAAVDRSHDVGAFRPWRGIVIVVLLVAVAIAGTWAFRDRVTAPAARAPPATGVGVAVAAGKRTLALLPPAIEGTESADRALAFAYIDGLREALARFPGVEVVGSESARIALLREQQPAKAGALLGVEYVLKTAFAREEGRVALELELLRVADHRSVWHQRFSQPSEQLFRTLGPALDAIEQVLATTARSDDPVLSAPVSAQDLYWRGLVELQLNEPGSPQRAIALFEQAIAVEPRFAAAHVGIATAWRSAVFTRDASLDEAAAKGRVAVARALEIDQELVSAHLAEVLLLTMQWRHVEAAAPLSKARLLAPDDFQVLHLTANLASYDGRPADAITLREQLAKRDPLSPWIYAGWGHDLAVSGQLDAALAKFAEARAIAGDFGYAREGAIRAYAANGRYADAMQQFERDGSRLDDIYVRFSIAAIHTAFGEVEQAQRVLSGFEPKSAEPPGFAQSVLALRWAQGDFAGALKWIEGPGNRVVQEPWRSVLRAHALALAGRRAEAHALYTAVFADGGNRDQLAGTTFVTRHGLGEIANWVVLDREQGGTGAAGLAYLQARIAHMTDGGYGLPLLDYYRAVEAALRGDEVAANAALGAALARGWCDDVAVRTDLVWTALREAPWLAARRAEAARKVDQERQSIRGSREAAASAARTN